MKRIALLLMLLALVPTQASALNTNDLLSLVAMPLAVDAVSRVTGVPQDQLAQFVSTLNQADVPPQQFVQTMRYAPVALQQPDFVPYVETQTSQGITGVQLVDVIDQRLPQYGVTLQPVQVVEVTPAYVLSDQYVYSPATLTSGNSNDLLSLIAMPLAVAAIADIAGVPQDQLLSLLSTLNQGNVPPGQFVQTLRYVPVALVEQPDFVPYLQTQVSNGVTGPALVTVIDQRLPEFAPAPAASTIVVTQDYVPPVVRTRVAEWHAHPRGGPPGQLKKLGFQTGAQVVHVQPVAVAPRVIHIPPGQARKEERHADAREHGHGHGRGHNQPPVVFVQPPMTSAAPPQPVFVPAPAAVPQDNGKGHGRGPGGEGPPGQQKEKGGKGHGHGKD
ncbi:MAG: hypothetical protein QOE82_2469 [Thermoanaerobaculia bacterium]|jgi:hypothetical protein|nr:hypothetical protein [Thermoanaerobaculia bacterium]